MGSQGLNDNELTIISSSSNINNVNRSINRGRYVEKYNEPCGKVYEKSVKTCGKSLRPDVAEAKADALIRIFDAPQCRNYFLKCVYHLPSSFIEKAISYATRPAIISPIRYFNRVTKAELSKQGL
jgi:hypothetical protein